MSSDEKSRLKYNWDRRLEECLSDLENGFDQEKVDQILNPSKLISFYEVISSIEGQIKELEDNVRAIRADGSADKYLIYEDQCRKLLTKLDDIVLNTESERQQRRRDIEKLVNCLRELKKSSVANLKQLLDYVKKRDVSNYHQHIYLQIEDVLNRSSGHTITEVDDLRFKLEEIKQDFE